MTVRYIPAATVCFILIINQQKTNSKSHSALDCFLLKLEKSFKGSLILTVSNLLLFYSSLFNFSSRLLSE